MLMFLFSWERQLLGEFTFAQGVCTHVSLSQEGERQLGASVAHWQTQGIEQRETVVEKETDAVRTLVARRFVSLQHPDAHVAFLCWVADHGMIAVDVPERLLPYWQKLCTLDLKPEERFASLQALRSAPYALVEAWEKGIDQLIHAASR